MSSHAVPVSVCGRWRGVERLLHHELHGVWSAEHVDGLGKPCRPLLGQAARFVFGFPGFQGGLLGQLQRLHRSGWAAVGPLEIGGEHGPPGFDAGSTRRPPGIQAGLTPTISRTGRFRGSWFGRSANRSPRLSRRWFSRAVL